MINDPYYLALSLGCDDEVAKQVAELIRADDSGWRKLWLERLNDPWWMRKFWKDDGVNYVDPIELARIIAGRKRSQDPFDPDTIRVQQFMDALDAGAEVTWSRIDTGEEIARMHYPGSAEGAAPQN